MVKKKDYNNVKLKKEKICGLCRNKINEKKESWVALIDFLKTEEKLQTFYHNKCFHNFLFKNQAELAKELNKLGKLFAFVSGATLKEIRKIQNGKETSKI